MPVTSHSASSYHSEGYEGERKKRKKKRFLLLIGQPEVHDLPGKVILAGTGASCRTPSSLVENFSHKSLDVLCSVEGEGQVYKTNFSRKPPASLSLKSSLLLKIFLDLF